MHKKPQAIKTMNQEYLNEPEEFDDQEGEEIEIEASELKSQVIPLSYINCSKWLT